MIHPSVRRWTIVVALGLTGCTLVSEPAGRLDLSLNLSTTDVRADSGMVVRVIAFNHQLQAIDLELACGDFLAYRLVVPGEDDPQPRIRACPDVTRRLSIAPGDSVVREFQFYPRPRFESGQLRRWLPGTYAVVGQLLGREGNVLEETDPIEFHLTCADPSWPEC